MHKPRDTNDHLREHGGDALRLAFDAAASSAGEVVRLEDFAAYMPAHSYIFKPTREMWPASSVNARVPNVDGKPASAWLDQNAPVEQMTWVPGEPMLIKDRLISDGGWIKRRGVTCFNLYRPPAIEPGNALEAERWLDHVSKVYPDDADHIICWLAHRVQNPHEKLNHALVLGGLQGIGKDTLLEPVRHAVGPWNFLEASPQQVLGRFNAFLKSTILRVSEARDLGEFDRFALYDHMKAYTAAPPDVLRVDEKHIREHSVPNVTGVIITTNHKTDGIHLPADDRRHYVAWSDLTKDSFVSDYWKSLWTWYRNGGIRHVAAYLSELDLKGFDPKAPPPKTAAFWEIVDANRAPEDAELADVLDGLGRPEVLTLAQIVKEASGDSATEDFADWLRDRKNARRVPHRMEACGYIAVRNPDDSEGRWKISGKRHTIYAKADRLAAAFKLSGSR
jgi:hypothetical protein